MSNQAEGIVNELYQRIDGRHIRPDWEGREVSAPLAKTVERLRLPARYALASLAHDVRDAYDPAVLKAALRYLVSFDQVVEHGRWLTLAGTSGAGKTYAAAAVANEIVARWFPDQAFDVEWLPVSVKLPELLDYRHFRAREEYYALRKRILNCHLLIIDDLLHAGEYAPLKELLFGVFDHRYQRKKPIVVTMNGEIAPDDWEPVESAFNGPFARRLADNSKGYTASV